MRFVPCLLLLALSACETGFGSWIDASAALDGGDPSSRDLAALSDGSDGGYVPPPPSFGETISLPDPPPPLSGGTLLITRDGMLALAADPDRDRVVLVDLGAAKVRAEVTLRAHDEPGRAIEDGEGGLHVVLRRAGEIVDLDRSGRIVARRSVCPAPRGIAWQPKTDQLVVACATGEVVRIPPSGGAPVRVTWIERDLRDVVIESSSGTAFVSTLRTATLLSLDERDTVTGRYEIPPRASSVFSVAFRTIAHPAGGLVVAHEQGLTRQISTQEGGYGDGRLCNDKTRGPIVASAVTWLRITLGHQSVEAEGSLLPGVVLPVDVAISPLARYAVVSPGSARIAGMPQVITIGQNQAAPACAPVLDPLPLDGQAVAVAYDPRGNLYVQTREPSALVLVEGVDFRGRVTIPLGGAPRTDTGWEIFHADSGSRVACASCHPEGGDDARTWDFDFGPRRTQWLRGGIGRRPPYHWNGDVTDLSELLDNVFWLRMIGPRMDKAQLGALTAWLDSVPSLPGPLAQDGDAVARGRALFLDPVVGCGTCHSGPDLTNLEVLDVGREMPFKVPSLIDVADHPPYLHDGCAATLAGRFVPGCGGDKHGNTAALTAPQMADLIKYLESL